MLLCYEEMEKEREEQEFSVAADLHWWQWALSLDWDSKHLGEPWWLKHLHSLNCWVLAQSWLFNSSLALSWCFSEWVRSLSCFHTSIWTHFCLPVFADLHCILVTSGGGVKVSELFCCCCWFVFLALLRFSWQIKIDAFKVYNLFWWMQSVRSLWWEL